MAAVLQSALGASAIIVCVPSLMTMWRSPSASPMICVTFALTLNTLNSKGARVPGSGTGFVTLMSCAIVVALTACSFGRSCSVFTVQRS